jgi:hypothetical protein
MYLPANRNVMDGSNFYDMLNDLEELTFDGFWATTDNLLSKLKTENYIKLVGDALEVIEAIEWSRIRKVYVLHQHVYLFRPNLGAENEEHGERF